jgi:hypothetical protein
LRARSVPLAGEHKIRAYAHGSSAYSALVDQCPASNRRAILVIARDAINAVHRMVGAILVIARDAMH